MTYIAYKQVQQVYRMWDILEKLNLCLLTHNEESDNEIKKVFPLIISKRIKYLEIKKCKTFTLKTWKYH